MDINNLDPKLVQQIAAAAPRQQATVIAYMGIDLTSHYAGMILPALIKDLPIDTEITDDLCDHLAEATFQLAEALTRKAKEHARGS